MKNLFEGFIFGLGFFLGVLLIVLLNLFLQPDESCNEVYMCARYGFPFSFLQTGVEEREGGNSFSQILYFGLIINIFVSALAGFLVGEIFSFLAERKLNLK